MRVLHAKMNLFLIDKNKGKGHRHGAEEAYHRIA
jgi:hypothetical protein